MKEYVDFSKSIEDGKIGENIFEKDFLNFLGIKYINVSDCQKFQIKDIDMDTSIGTYEIKTNYKDDKQIVIEEYTNIEKRLGDISLGWVYKSKADLLVFVSKKTNVMIFIPFTEEFKIHYESIKEGYKLTKNFASFLGGREWRSAFRRIPLSSIDGYYSFYKKVKNVF